MTARNVSTYLRKTPVRAPSLGGETVVCVFSHWSRADPMHNRWLHEAEPGAPSETDVAKNQRLGIYHGSFGEFLIILQRPKERDGNRARLCRL